MGEEAKKVVVGSYFKCPDCGAYLQFRKGSLVCPYCGHREGVETQSSYPTYMPFQKVEVAKEEVEFKCPGCNAQFAVPPHTVAKRCPYCSIPLIGEFLNPLTPSEIIPFKLSPEEAYKKGVQFLKKGFFVYSRFKQEFQKYREVEPVYYPLWLFNMECQVEYEGERGIVEVEYEYGPKGERIEREYVTWTPVSGSLHLTFQNQSYVGYGEKTRYPLYLSRLRWNLSSCRKFKKELLAGAEGVEYGVDSELALKQVHASLQSRIVRAIERDIGGDRQRVNSYDATFYNEEMAYILIPAYHFSVKWRGREYHIFINGATGEVTGDKPYNPLLIGLVILLIALAIGGIYYYLYIHQGG
jgi:DNA-directed RNA polymerase subunit RPC12/RpoP